MGIAHFDETPAHDRGIGHIQGRWSMLGAAAGCVKVGVRRIQVPAGGWTTPAHEHGREEEIFYVLSGRGISWQAGVAAEVGPRDCIVYLTNGGAHTLHALEPLDVLAFGERHDDESVGFPRLGLSLLGNRAVESLPYLIDGAPIQFVRESELGPPPLPDPLPGPDTPRPRTIVNVDDVEGVAVQRPRVVRTRRNLGRAAGSISTGIQHVEVAPGKYSTAQHCHSVEEEIFVILGGGGVLVLGQEETTVRPGHVIARPAGTGVAHVFRAGDQGLTYLAYGTRDPADICFYPRSNKIAIRGLGLVARLERLDYWDGED
jgi:uncharacterized cupin superfamily protein